MLDAGEPNSSAKSYQPLDISTLTGILFSYLNFAKFNFLVPHTVLSSQFLEYKLRQTLYSARQNKF